MSELFPPPRYDEEYWEAMAILEDEMYPGWRDRVDPNEYPDRDSAGDEEC